MGNSVPGRGDKNKDDGGCFKLEKKAANATASVADQNSIESGKNVEEIHPFILEVEKPLFMNLPFPVPPIPTPGPSFFRSKSSQRLTLHHLAHVEIALILQCLDTISLVTAARCSKRLLAEGYSRFTWQERKAFSLQPIMLSQLNHRSIIREFAPLRWIFLSNSTTSAQEVKALSRLNNLREIEFAPSASLDDAKLVELIKQPNIHRTLSKLNLGSQGGSGWRSVQTLYEAIASLPQLKAISFTKDVWDKETIALLAKATKLRSLEIRMGAYQQLTESDFQALAQTSVRRLFFPSTGGFSSFSRGSCWNYFIQLSPDWLAQVQHLTFDRVNFSHTKPFQLTDGYTDELLRTGWKRMMGLRTIDLTHCVGIDTILPTLVTCVSLERIYIRGLLTDDFYNFVFNDFSFPRGITYTLPSIAHVQAFLADAHPPFECLHLYPLSAKAAKIQRYQAELSGLKQLLVQDGDRYSNPIQFSGE